MWGWSTCRNESVGEGRCYEHLPQGVAHRREDGGRLVWNSQGLGYHGIWWDIGQAILWGPMRAHYGLGVRVRSVAEVGKPAVLRVSISGMVAAVSTCQR